MAASTAGFVVALSWEQRLLSALLPRNCRLLCSGMGVEAASVAARQLLHDGADMLVSCGCCAGLSADLRAGDVLIASAVLASDGTRFAVTAEALSTVQKRFAPMFAAPDSESGAGRSSARRQPAVCHTGTLLTLPAAVAEPQHKQQVASVHSAQAADMESVAIASVAAQAGVPFVAVRVVLDDCRQSLPEAVTASCNNYGDVNSLALLRACGRQPGLLLELVALARSRSRAASSLRRLAAAWPTMQRATDTPGVDAARSQPATIKQH
ncbi:MAG: purine phosphorylase [Wenzhouxiangellaceae bacterium]